MTVLPSTAPVVEAPAARDWWTPAELVMLGAIWGSSFLFMRIAAADFGPVPLVAMRLLTGVGFLLPFLWRARERITRRHLLWFVVVGALNSAIPFTLFAWGAERAPAGIGAIANSMTVLFAALVAFLVFGERIGPRRAIALVAGFVGVVILASGRTAGANVMGAAIAGTAASLCYGFAINLTKHKLSDLPPVVGVAGTLSSGTLIALPLAVAMWPSTPIPAKSWLAATLLGVLCTGFAYWLFFRLIQRIGPSRASTTTYLVPIFGVAWGWLLLGEQPTWTMVASAALILGSVILAQREAQRNSPLPLAGEAARKGG
ncbi:MAG TPA: DMT family transporter [Rhodanobacteraceae bacterium]|nr:DMT family transporter [Rhodanobacteraceae bacterium]